jgi:hypothetical protein
MVRAKPWHRTRVNYDYSRITSRILFPLLLCSQILSFTTNVTVWHRYLSHVDVTDRRTHVHWQTDGIRNTQTNRKGRILSPAYTMRQSAATPLTALTASWLGPCRSTNTRSALNTSICNSMAACVASRESHAGGGDHAVMICVPMCKLLREATSICGGCQWNPGKYKAHERKKYEEGSQQVRVENTTKPETETEQPTPRREIDTRRQTVQGKRAHVATYVHDGQQTTAHGNCGS